MLQSFNHADLATAVLVMAIYVVAQTFYLVFLTYGLIETQSNYLKADREILEKITKLESDLEKKLTEPFDYLQPQIDALKAELNRPLYEVGNIVEYNRGVGEYQGIYPDYEGEIIEVIEAENHRPAYLVKSIEGEVAIQQDMIKSWR